MRVAARLSGILRFAAASAVVALTLAGGSAYATLNVTTSSVTTSNHTVITLVACNGGTTCPSGDTLALSANGEGATLSGSASGSNGSTGSPNYVFEATTTGVVDTFLLFSITSPIQSTSVGIYATGCGDNITGCNGNSSSSSASATATVTAATAMSSYALSGTYLGPSSGVSSVFNSTNTSATAISATDTFSSAVPGSSTFYVLVDLKVNVSTGTSYAAFDSVTLTVPEPVTWTVFALGLTGLGVVRRRRLNRWDA